MALRVTCSSCHSRFDVSEKFAGQEGPCPKCKATIRIPALDEQVVIHAPADSGPKDSKGRPVLKPISRKETQLMPVQWAILGASMIAFLAIALMLRIMIADKAAFPVYGLALCALAIAFPASFAAYAFLRNQDTAPFKGQDLWVRIGITAMAYSLLWFLMPLMAYAFPGNDLGSVIGLLGMIVAGGCLGMLAMELDYLFGILHYGLYLVICLAGRLMVGLEVLPGGFGDSPHVPSTIISGIQTIVAVQDWLQFMIG